MASTPRRPTSAVRSAKRSVSGALRAARVSARSNAVVGFSAYAHALAESAAATSASASAKSSNRTSVPYRHRNAKARSATAAADTFTTSAAETAKAPPGRGRIAEPPAAAISCARSILATAWTRHRTLASKFSLETLPSAAAGKASPPREKCLAAMRETETSDAAQSAEPPPSATISVATAKHSRSTATAKLSSAISDPRPR
mmetsp:Transcript_4570/g.14484  ORF Transcript_4570/g.14484 Transcript_4570/m.14484 type:complete len:202 (-) Transcript_4570:910-1515(-)